MSFLSKSRLLTKNDYRSYTIQFAVAYHLIYRVSKTLNCVLNQAFEPSFSLHLLAQSLISGYIPHNQHFAGLVLKCDINALENKMFADLVLVIGNFCWFVRDVLTPRLHIDRMFQVKTAQNIRILQNTMK